MCVSPWCRVWGTYPCVLPHVQHIYDTATVGAFAAHALKYKHGGLRSLVSLAMALVVSRCVQRGYLVSK
jgi:hypothetical protein